VVKAYLSFIRLGIEDPTMFDLEKAIAAWRRSLEYNSALLREDVDELESHVRDQVRGLVLRGLTEEEAFERAVRQMGGYGTVESEYQKVYWGKVRRQGLTHELNWRASMFRNYLIVAFRNLLRHKGYSFINVAGLALGLTCCLLIFQYVIFEYSFDRFNENAQNLYRISWTQVQNEGEPITWPTTAWAVGPALAQEAPEVIRFARLHPEYNTAIVSNPAEPDIVFEEENVYYADPAFLEMFSYPLVQGEPGQALSEPGTVLLSRSAARKYFGPEDPMGQVLDVRGWISGSFRVGGIFEDIPANSHLQFSMLLPMVDLLQRSRFSDPSTGWGWNNFITYVQLGADVDLAEAGQNFTDIYLRHRQEEFRQSNTTARVSVQPLLDIHLNDDISAPKAVMGSYRAVYFFTIIGFVTLLIAIVNYVNLATARAINRAREVGVRKTAGANQGQLVTQFLFEAALTNIMAVCLAIVLAVILTPAVNTLAGTSLTNAIWVSPGFWAIFFAAFCAVTLLAGVYPAFVLSSFRPVTVLKGKAGSFTSQTWLRRGLVVLQFAASVVLLVGTAVLYTQLDFMRNMDLGLNLEQALTVPSPRVLPEDIDQAEVVETFAQELRQLPAVRQTATSFTVPGRGYAFTTNIRKAAADPSTEIEVFATYIDTSFASLYGLELIAGNGFRNTSTPLPEGEPRPVMANETTIRALGFDTPEDALGQVLGANRFRLVGVFKDFNWSSAHETRENALFLLERGNPQISIKVGTKNLSQTIAAIEHLYKQHFPGDPFRYAFVDEQFEQQYRSDQRFAALFGIFAGLAIAIACLGLYGLASFTAQQRTKEIGVRKVLGASIASIIALLSTDFLKLVGIAFVVAAPLAYLGMERWLEDFAYHIEIGPGIFLFAGGLLLLIAVLTVSYQSVKAALADPVKSLRYE
jgi:putative ABC transport system permease protein